MHLSRRDLGFAVGGALALGVAFAPAMLAQSGPLGGAGSPGVTQEVLISAPLAQLPGKRVTVFTGEFHPGAGTPFHRHPGTEILYVLEGRGRMEIEGREAHDLALGEAVLVEPEQGAPWFTHRALNGSETERMKTLVVVIHDEGHPPALPQEPPTK